MKDRRTGTIYVDVDGTLLLWPTKAGSPRPGETPAVNRPLVEAIQRWKGGGDRTVVVWTMGGKAHAEMAARICGLDAAVCLAKPEAIIDDADAALWHKKHHAIAPQRFIEAVQ